MQNKLKYEFGFKDYDPFGMITFGRSWEAGSEYRYGFNGKESVSEIHPNIRVYDYGERIYDIRIGKWFSIDPMQYKYTDLSPYNFTGNNPIKFIDFNGENFGVIINHNTKTIIIVSNIYTTSEKSYRQAQRTANRWNSKSAVIEGYTVTFQVEIMKPVVVSDEEAIALNPNILKKNGKLRKNQLALTKANLAQSKALASAEKDPTGGNVFVGNSGFFTKTVDGEEYKGGGTVNGTLVVMNTHTELGDLGEYDLLVGHEFGHLFGLQDEINSITGEPNIYFCNDGIMKYKTIEQWNDISNCDITQILHYAKDYLIGNTTNQKVKVTIISNTGESNGNNPLGLAGEWVPSGCE